MRRFVFYDGVSIHAPARRATEIADFALEAYVGFNPRPRTGGDITANIKKARLIGFNPRPRTGGDSISRSSAACNAGFNPRPRTGGD